MVELNNAQMVIVKNLQIKVFLTISIIKTIDLKDHKYQKSISLNYNALSSIYANSCIQFAIAYIYLFFFLQKHQ